jgi:polysaccharide biosynthesis transport protein
VQTGIKSDIVTLEYFDEDARRASEVANAIADSYMSKRTEVERTAKTRILDDLKSELSAIEIQVSQARAKMMKAKRDAGIVGDHLSNGVQGRMPGAQVMTADGNMALTREQQLYRLKTDLMASKTELTTLKSLSPDQLVGQAAALKLENSNLTALVGELNKASLTLEGSASSGLGARHPTVMSLQDQIRKNKELILAEATAYILGLENKVAGFESQHAELVSENKDQNTAAIDKQAAAEDYLAALKDVEQYEFLQQQRRDRLMSETSNLALSKNPATIWQASEVESTPAKPRVAVNLSLGAIVGLMFGLGLAFALEYMDTSVKSLDDVERFLGVPVLAVIPQNVGVLHRTTGFAPDAEAYRILRTNIEFNRKTANANCITVVSGGAGEGKSTTLTNLAYVCAQGGYNVLLIDADLRRPRLHTLFDTSNAVGLTNYLTSHVQLEDVVLKTPVDNLYFLPSGMLPADGAGILNSQRMSDLIADVKSRFDLVLIDSPPILGVSDASVLANEADMTIIVVQHRKLPRQMLLRVKQAVENVGGNVLGVVLNNVDIRSDSSYAYYTSYYTYYAPSNMPGGAPERRKRKRGAAPATTVAGARQNNGGDVF